MVNDPIADFITQIRNAGAVKKESVQVPFSQEKMRIAEVLKAEGYINDVSKSGKKTSKTVDVAVSYEESGQPRIRGTRRISKPSRRVYLGASDIQPVKQGSGTLIMSTPEGVMTGSDARKKHIGGEALFEIW